MTQGFQTPWLKPKDTTNYPTLYPAKVTLKRKRVFVERVWYVIRGLVLDVSELWHESGWAED